MKISEHLQDSQMTYSQHLVHGVGSGIYLLLLGVSSILHGLVPSILPQHAARGVVKLYQKNQHRDNFQRLIREEQASQVVAELSGHRHA